MYLRDNGTRLSKVVETLICVTVINSNYSLIRTKYIRIFFLIKLFNESILRRFYQTILNTIF